MISRKQLEEIAATVQGVPVFGCLPGSSAAEAGVRYGDIVLSANGVRTLGIDEYVAARSLRADGLELRLLRGGQELALFVEFRAPEEKLESLVGQIAEGRYLGNSDLPEADSKGLPQLIVFAGWLMVTIHGKPHAAFGDKGRLSRAAEAD